MSALVDASLETQWRTRFCEGSASVKEEIFQEMFQTFKSQVHSLCLRITRNPAEAEDAVQETFLAIFECFSKFEGKSSLSTWIYRIAIRTSYRVRAKCQKGTKPLLNEVSGESTEERILEREQGMLFRKALETLSIDHRTTISLFMVKGFSQKEISEVLNIPEGTVWSRIYEAKKKLAQEIARLKIPSFPPKASSVYKAAQKK